MLRFCNFVELRRSFLIFQTFQLLEYEDELDFLAIAVTNWEDDETIAHIQLHDNQTGSLQKKIDLIEPWDEVSNQRMLVHLRLFVFLLFYSNLPISRIRMIKKTFGNNVYLMKIIHSDKYLGISVIIFGRYKNNI